MAVSKLQKVPVREAFPHEAHRFTVWLETNIDALSEGIGLQLSVEEREKPVGSFTVDLVCRDNSGNRVIVENQLEHSDHDHLGKLLTYMINLEAKAAIWVTPEVRPEHERVIDWLNEVAGADYAFYLIRIEAVRIADSPYAPLFTVVAAPDQQTRDIGEAKSELAERERKFHSFWKALIERIQGRTHLFANITPSRGNWIATGAGKAGLTYIFTFTKGEVVAELYIDTVDHDRNKAIFDALQKDKEACEAECGASLRWHRLDNRRASRIQHVVGKRESLHHEEEWPDLQDALIDAMIRLEQTFHQRIANLKV